MRPVSTEMLHRDAPSGMMDYTFAGAQLQLRFSISFPALKQFKCPYRGVVHPAAESQTLQELDLQHLDMGHEVSGVNITLGSLPRLEVLRLNLHLEAKVVAPISPIIACICCMINAFNAELMLSRPTPCTISSLPIARHSFNRTPRT